LIAAKEGDASENATQQIAVVGKIALPHQRLRVLENLQARWQTHNQFNLREKLCDCESQRQNYQPIRFELRINRQAHLAFPREPPQPAGRPAVQRAWYRHTRRSLTSVIARHGAYCSAILRASRRFTFVERGVIGGFFVNEGIGMHHG